MLIVLKDQLCQSSPDSDLLGLFGSKAKSFIQQLWTLEIDWSERLPEKEASELKEFAGGMLCASPSTALASSSATCLASSSALPPQFYVLLPVFQLPPRPRV
ncbi:hypothetical protein TNCV_3732061 [Trichonephila clavipes]|nr:hypothetical protein TNCV_3732061 [Trichonephila clavipes]